MSSLFPPFFFLISDDIQYSADKSVQRNCFLSLFKNPKQICRTTFSYEKLRGTSNLGWESAGLEPHSGSCATLRGMSKMQCGSTVRRTYVFLFFRSETSNFWERVWMIIQKRFHRHCLLKLFVNFHRTYSF